MTKPWFQLFGGVGSDFALDFNLEGTRTVRSDLQKLEPASCDLVKAAKAGMQLTTIAMLFSNKLDEPFSQYSLTIEEVAQWETLPSKALLCLSGLSRLLFLLFSVWKTA